MIKHGAGGKMYTAIVCDDDEIITQGIASFIPWKKIGIELCGIAYDGTAARKLIDDLNFLKISYSDENHTRIF